MDKTNKNLVYLETYRGVRIYMYQYMNMSEVVSFDLDGDDYKCLDVKEAKEQIDSIKEDKMKEYLERKSKEAYWAYCDSLYKTFPKPIN